MKNFTLDDVVDVGSQDIANMSTEDLALLWQELQSRKKTLTDIGEILQAGCAQKYLGGEMQDRTGVMEVKDGQHTIKITRPKRVVWDNEELKKARTRLEEQHFNPEDYMATTYKIPERAFANWPSVIQQIFTQAREVKTGKATFTFTQKGGVL